MLDHHVQRLYAATPVTPVDRPDHVTKPPPQLVGDVFGRAFAQGVEVERADPSRRPLRGDEPDEQVLDDAVVCEQAFVRGVVHDSPPVAAPSQWRRSIRREILT